MPVEDYGYLVCHLISEQSMASLGPVRCYIKTPDGTQILLQQSKAEIRVITNHELEAHMKITAIGDYEIYWSAAKRKLQQNIDTFGVTNRNIFHHYTEVD